MLARLQRLITLSVLLLAALWISAFAWMGHPFWGAFGCVLLLSGYAIFLAAEFLMLALVDDAEDTPKARVSEMLQAWWGEVKTAPLVFCWRQPFRSNAEPDHLPAATKGSHGLHGIVFVHGFVCNRGFWNPWMSRLRRDGVAFVAVNLEPLFGSIDAYSQIIESAVARIEASTGLPPVLVAHSMGGLAVRRWLVEYAGGGRVRRIVTIGTPHRGTWLARFGRTINGREMGIASPWLTKLADRTSEPAPALFTCFYGNCDNIVFPPSTGMLPGADNRLVRRTAHVQMAFREEVFNEVKAWLGRNLSTASPGDQPGP